MTTTTFDKSKAMALKMGAVAPARFCTFAIRDDRKIPHQRGGQAGVPATISDDDLFTAEDIHGMEDIRHGQFFGLSMNKPIVIEGKGYLVCLDVDMKRRPQGDPHHSAIKNLESWVNKVGALNEKSVSGKGHHVFVFANTAGNVLRKYALSQGQEIEVFGLPSSDKKSILLTGEAMEGEVVEVDDFEGLLIELGIAKKEVVLQPMPAQALRGNLEFLYPAQALAPRANPQLAWERAVEALRFIHPDTDYDKWVKVGQALQDAFGEHGLNLWSDWSSGGTKYKGQADIDTHWRSFHQGGGVGIGTLFHIAKESGYQVPAGVLHLPVGADFSGLTIDNETGEVVNHPLAVFVDCDVKAKPPRWVIPGFVGHGVTVISGGHGVGKTTALLPLALTAAGLHGDELMPSHWRHVVYVSEDIDQAKRILAGIVLHGNLGIDPEALKERLHLVEAVRLDPAFVVMVGTTYRCEFTRIVDGVEVLPLVVLDTKSAVFDIENENDNGEASKMMAALKQGFNGLPVWLIGHIAKASANSTEGLTTRGASAIEADANQTIFVVSEKGRRYFKLGKTRFEPKWRELEITSHTFGTIEIDEFGNSELVTLRWGVALPAWQSSTEAKERALEAQQKEKVASVRVAILTAVDTAWNLGYPLNRQTIKSKVGGSGLFTGRQINLLLAERWLHEIQVPPKDRQVNSKASFFICLTPHEHDALLAGADLPQGKTVIPATWKKVPNPPILGALDDASKEETAEHP
jgi:hypothetical protein